MRFFTKALNINNRPEFVFLFLGLVLGLSYLFITPPFQVPDEPNHFFRAYQTSEGTFLAEKTDNRVGGLLPASLQKVATAYRKVTGGDKVTNDPSLVIVKKTLLNKNEREFIDFNNTALYSPVCYLPQAAGILLFRVLDLPVIYLLYASRIFALLAWIALIFFAIRLIPTGKWLFCALALLPMSLFINSSASADVMTNGVAFLFIATVLNSALSDKKMDRNRFLFICILVFLIPLLKTIYVTLIPLLFIIPRRNLGSWPRYIMLFASWALITLVPFVYWSNEVRAKYLSYENYNKDYRDKVALFEHVDADKQLAFIKKHNVVAVRVVRRSTFRLIKYHVPAYIASLGWIDVNPPRWFCYLLYGCILLIAMLEHNVAARITCGRKVVLIMVFFVTLSALFITMFLTWVGPGPQVVKFIQGRYLIPFYPLLLLSLNSFIRNRSQYLPLLVTGTSVIGSACCIYMLIARYY